MVNHLNLLEQKETQIRAQLDKEEADKKREFAKGYSQTEELQEK